MLESSEVSDFRDEADRRHTRDAAPRLPRVDDRRPAPRGRERPALVGDARHAPRRFIDGVAVFLQRDVLRGQRDTEVGEPASVRERPPGASRIAATLAQQERLQSMLGLGAQADGVFARAHAITHGFIIGRWDIDRRAFAGAVQSGQGVAIAPIGRDPIAAPFGQARRIDDRAVFALRRQVPVDPTPARAGFA